MIRKVATIIVLMLIGISAFTQTFLLMGKDSTWQNSRALLEFSGNANIRSNVLTNQAMSKFVFGGHFGIPELEEMEDDLREVNRIGGELDGSLAYYSFQDSVFSRPGMGWKFQASYVMDLGTSFSEDFFKLAFFGNERFRGDTAHLDFTGASFMAYQKLGFGVFDKETLSGISLSLVNGQEFQQLRTYEGDFYTSELGDSIAFEYNGAWESSDPNFRGFGAGNGIGAAIDANINIPYSENKGYITIRVNNLGFVKWTSGSQVYTGDTLTHYNGFDIQDLLDGNTELSSLEQFQDSLLFDQTNKERFTPLKGSLEISSLKRINADDFFEFGVRIKPSYAHVPEVYGGYYLMTNNKTMVSANARIGGYGGLRFGASVRRWIGEDWFFQLTSDDVPGLILNDLKGRGVYFSLAKFFNKV